MKIFLCFVAFLFFPTTFQSFLIKTDRYLENCVYRKKYEQSLLNPHLLQKAFDGRCERSPCLRTMLDRATRLSVDQILRDVFETKIPEKLIASNINGLQ